jgi:hypothetical protein
MLKRVSILVIASLVVAGLGACSAKVEGGAVPLPNFSNSTGPATVLEGNWASGCAGSSGFYMSATFAFVGNSMNGTIKIFSDSQCSKLIQQQNQAGTFSIGGPAAVAGATNINYLVNGGTTYDIFEIQGGTLYLGNNPGTTEATRSATLNTQLPLQKMR